MTTYEKIRAKLNELDHKRTELRFGCELQVTNPSLGNPIHAFVSEREDGFDGYQAVLNDGKSVVQFGKPEARYGVSVLGQPVSMAEVLLAIQWPLFLMEDAELDMGGGFMTACWRSASGERGCLLMEMAKPVSEWPEEELEKVLRLIG